MIMYDIDALVHATLCRVLLAGRIGISPVRLKSKKTTSLVCLVVNRVRPGSEIADEDRTNLGLKALPPAVVYSWCR